MRALRRHVLYASQEHETSVGDAEAKASVLRLWLNRRHQFLHDVPELTRVLVFFWTLAKPTRSLSLTKHDYVAFFQCVAKALVQSVGLDHAARVAARDWRYDCAGGSDDHDDEANAAMSLEQFREALFQVADLVLPVESDASRFASFFQDLRDAIAMHPQPTAQAAATVWPPDARRYRLRALKDVVKIRGVFLQQMPPNADHLAQIRGLASPDMDHMSLKQLLLSYNPRKLALSRTFSSLFAPGPAAPVAATEATERRQLVEEKDDDLRPAASPPVVSLLAAAPLLPSEALGRERDDAFDVEDADVASIETFPALRIAVVGPPGAGKSRVAASLAQRLGLQYLSTAKALESAFRSTLAREAVRQERRRERAEARDASDASDARAAAEAQTEQADGEGEAADAKPTEHGQEEEDRDAERVDDADLRFGDAELAALQRGEALATHTARPILVACAKRTLLRGVGVVLDDVFPSEADGLTIDYVVSLEMARDDARENVAGFTLAPTSRRVYSARERAMLRECDAVLREQGLSDSQGFVEPLAVDGAISADDGGLYAQRRARVADAVAAAHAALAAAKVKPAGEKGEDGETEGDGEATPLPTGAAGDADVTPDGGSSTSDVTSTPQSPAQRNESEPPDEPTVPLTALLGDAFTTRYRGFEVRAQGLTTTTKTQVIAVVAAQALSDIVAQCVVAITNTSLGISRAATSRAVLPITLPEAMAASGSRADQLRWLLYGDWTDALADLSPTPFAAGPVDPRQPRALSRWRDCCVVSAGSPSPSPTPIPPVVLGDPQWAAYFGGRVYLFASSAARESFGAAPLQYIRRCPPSRPSARKLWIVSSDSLDSDTAIALAGLVGGDHVTATDALASHQSLQHVMELVEGKPLAPTAEVARVVANVLADKQAWVLSDLIPTRQVIDTLRERGCLPDAIVLLAVDEADAVSVLPSPLARKKYELFAASYVGNSTAEDTTASRLTELLTETPLLPSLPVVRSKLLSDASDTQAALFRLLSPWAPRVDSVDDGTKRESTDAEEEHLRVFRPVTDDATEQADPPPADGDDADASNETNKPPVDPLGYDPTQRVWVANRRRMGETAQFCAVTWATKRVLVPGQAQYVASFQQKLYALAGEQELAAFERNPIPYVPLAPRATQRHVPVVWLLGMRGSDVDALVHATSEALRGGARVGVLDDAAVAKRIERRLRAQLLRPTDKQTPPSELYVEELSLEIQRLTASGAWDAVVVATVSLATVRVPAQLEVEENGETSPLPMAPSLPTPELLAQCFERDTFPTTVVPLAASEERMVQRQLTKWRDALPPPRPPRKPVATDGDTSGDSEDPEAVDVVALEAAETARLEEQFQRDQEALAVAVETLRARGLSIERAVRVDATSRAVVKSLTAAIATLLARKDSLFECCERVSLPRAQQLLRSGQAVVGKHALRCPTTGTSSPSPTNVLVYRGRLYFPQSASCLTQCEHAPAATLVDTCSQPPQCRVTCCVVGPPCVGKTQLARKLAAQFGLAYVSPRSAVEWLLQCLMPQSALWRKLQHARAGGDRDWFQQLDAALVHEVVHTRLCSADCQRHGWVLDDYVATSDHLARCLDEDKHQPIHPGVVFVLEGTIQHAWQRATTQDRGRLGAAFAAWHTRHRLELLHAWTRTFGAFHVRQLDADATCAWQVHAQASAVLREHARAMRHYTQGVAMARPVRLHGVVRTQRALEEQAHEWFQSFCPVALSVGNYHTTLPQQRERCVECVDPSSGCRIAVWLANEQHVRAFCAAPVAYVTDESVTRAKELVDKAPVDASLLSLLSVADCEFPEMKGYCPVTFQQGTGDKDWQAIVKGSVFYRVSYEGKVWFCLSEHQRQAFISQPSKYASLVLPIKLPPQLTASTAFKNCPGRIEQELSGVLNETLLQLGATRPKFLGVSTRASACVYVALLLKTRAPAKALPDHIRAKYTDQLRAFERDCRLGEQLKGIILPNTTTSRGSGIKGARAVRELSASASESDLQRAQHREEADHSSSVDSGDALRTRFDELVRSAQLEKPTNSNQPTTTPRANEWFLSYATPVAATTNGSSSSKSASD